MNLRKHDLGRIPGIVNEMSLDETLGLFRSICVNRYFELEAAQVHDTGVMKSPIYLSVGQEQIPAAIAAASLPSSRQCLMKAKSLRLSVTVHGSLFPLA